MNNTTKIRRYECCLCRRAPEEIADPAEAELPSADGTPKIARVLIDVGGVQKSFDICWECSVSTCSSFAATAKFHREQVNPDPPRRAG